jgi:phosphoglycerol transferase MdoB-like AlkP superfamily enzyme
MLFQTLKELLLSRTIYRALLSYLLIVMILFSFSRVGFYFYNLDFFAGMTAPRFMTILWGGLRFDLTATLYCNALLVLLMILPFEFRFNRVYKSAVKWLFIVLNAVAFAVNTIDFIYYRFTLRRTTVSVFSQFENEKNLPLLFLQFLIDYWYAVIFWIFIVFILVVAARRIDYQKPTIKSKAKFYLVGVGMLLVVVYLFVGGVRGGFRHSTRPITISNAAAYAAVPNDINLVLNTPFALLRTAKAHVIQKVNYFASDAELAKNFDPVRIPSSPGGMTKKNVVIIILESFSKEFVGAYNKNLKNGTYKGYTPFLDSLIGVGDAYQYSFANGRKSIDAMPSVISSLPSFEVPYVLSHYSGNKIWGMPDLLKKEGYYTAFFHGAPNGSMGFDAFANLSGFEKYYGKTEYNNDADFDGIWGIWDEPFLQFFADQMNTFRQPFFTTVFTVSSHHPFKIPEKYEGTFVGGPKVVHRTIQYTDYALKKFFEKARTMPWFNNTVFVITADHVSSEVEFDEYNTPSGYFSIPIFFYEPARKGAGMQEKIIQQIDIMPTVLGKLGYSKPFFSFGQNVEQGQVRPMAINYANAYQLFMGDYLLQFDGNKSTGFFSFKNDLFLKNNLIGNLPDSVQLFEKKIKAFIQQYDNRIVDNKLTVE